MNVKFLDDSGDTSFFDVDGDTFGITSDDEILDHDGYPMSYQWQGANADIVEALKIRTRSNEVYNSIASYMDDEVRESLHGSFESGGEFLVAYLEKDPEFIELLRGEFNI